MRWVDALSVGVRPVIAYWFMAQYCAAKPSPSLAPSKVGQNGSLRPKWLGQRWAVAESGGAELLVLEPRVWLVIGVIEVPLAAIDLAKRFKDMHRVSKHDLVHAHPLVCPACCWIIGYGHLCDSMHLPITEGEADA